MRPRTAPLALERSHVVVTGASRGIGAALARELAGRGARVTVVARNEAELARVAAAVNGRAIRADLGNPDAVDGLIARIEAEVGSVDVLINNAALAVVGLMTEQSSADVRRSFAVNTVAPIELCRQALPGMLGRGRGALVNISSLAGVAAFPTLATYGATKAGLAHFTAALQRELRTCPVRAIIVQLGEVSGTELMEQARRSPTIRAVSARFARLHALPALTPERVAAGIADAIAVGRNHVVIPARVSLFHLIRELPSRLNDLALIGID